MRHLISYLGGRLFLRAAGVQYGKGVVIEGRKQIVLGSNIDMKEGVRVRSRRAAAKIAIGDSVRLREFCEINAKGEPVEIGAHCFVAKGVWIGGFGSITIGQNTMLGIRSLVASSDHDYVNIGVPYYDGSEKPKPIRIGSNVWIAAGCIILAGTTIGSGSVVGAGSVVRGIFSDNSLIMGAPAELKSTIER